MQGEPGRLRFDHYILIVSAFSMELTYPEPLLLYIMCRRSLSSGLKCLNLQSVLNGRMKNDVFLSVLGRKNIKGITCGGSMRTIDAYYLRNYLRELLTMIYVCMAGKKKNQLAPAIT